MRLPRLVIAGTHSGVGKTTVTHTGLLGEQGARIRGHEFHYSTLIPREIWNISVISPMRRDGTGQKMAFP